MLTEKAIKILEKRGLDMETLIDAGIRSIDKGAGKVWIEIDYLRNGEVVNRKRRTIEGSKEFYQEPDGAQCFYNHDCLKKLPKKIIITEGELDCLSLIQCGFADSVSVPNGAPAKAMGGADTPRYEYLPEAKALLTDCVEIILATDNDNPGINLMHDLSLRLGSSRCKFVTYPFKKDRKTRCKDINEVLAEWGAKGVTETIAQANWLDREGVYSMSELPELPEREVVKIGFPVLDDYLRVAKGQFCVITGIPSHGKSSFINDIACRLAVNHNWRIAFASFEQTPQTQHRRNLLAWRKANDPAWLEKHFRFMVPTEDDIPNLEWLLAKMQMAVIQHDCDMIVIDPWNEMDHTRPEQMTMTEYVGLAIKEMKRMAMRLNVFVIVAAHPSKMRRENGKFQPPTLYDISDSAHWANKPDIGLTVFRPNKDIDKCEVHVQKIRFQPEMGKPGKVELMYYYPTRRYESTQIEERGGLFDETI